MQTSVPGAAVAVLSLLLAGTVSPAFADDTEPPVTSITSVQQPGLEVGGDRTFGDVTDDSSGVARVSVTFTPMPPGAAPVSGDAALGCATPTRCRWVIEQPPAPGVYAVTAVATDAAGNVESPGASITLISVGAGSVPLEGGLVPDDSDTPIQPGAPIDLHRGPLAGTPYGVCTMNFVFEDAAHTYIGTAGHCVIMVGERTTAPGIGEFGTVVFMKDCGYAPCPGGSIFDDFALIRIDADKTGLVSPEVRGFGPLTGTTTGADAAPGDLVFMHGWGIGFSEAPATRDRVGLLLTAHPDRYTSTLPATSDSGSALVHASTGKALGIVATRDITEKDGLVVTGGPTVERILALLADAGFSVTLVTGPAD